jgi:hypothetical protein
MFCLRKLSLHVKWALVDLMPVDLDYLQSLESSNTLHKPFLYVGSTLNVDSQYNRCFWSAPDIFNYWRGSIPPVCIVVSRSSISFLSSIMILFSYASFFLQMMKICYEKSSLGCFFNTGPLLGLSFKILGIFFFTLTGYQWQWRPQRCSIISCSQLL